MKVENFSITFFVTFMTTYNYLSSELATNLDLKKDIL